MLNANTNAHNAHNLHTCIHEIYNTSIHNALKLYSSLENNKHLQHFLQTTTVHNCTKLYTTSQTTTIQRLHKTLQNTKLYKFFKKKLKKKLFFWGKVQNFTNKSKLYKIKTIETLYTTLQTKTIHKKA